MPPKSKISKQSSGTAKAKSSQQPATEVANQTPTPNWPLLTPLPPPEDLSFDTLLSDQILTVSNFWTSNLCKNYVNFLKTLPLTTTPGKPKRGEAVRVNDRLQVQDAGFAARLWLETGLRELVMKPVVDGEELSEEATKKLWGGEVLSLNPNIRIYRYSKGQFFDQHCTMSCTSILYSTFRLRDLQTTTRTTSPSSLQNRQRWCPRRRPGRCCSTFPHPRLAAKAVRRSSTPIRHPSAKQRPLLSSQSSKSACSCFTGMGRTVCCTKAER